MRTAAFVLVAALLLTSFSVHAGHTTTPTTQSGDDVTLVAHDCNGESPAHDLTAAYAGSGVRTIDHDNNAATADVATKLVILQVVFSIAPATAVPESARLITGFEADGIHAHKTVVQSEDNWETITVLSSATDARSTSAPVHSALLAASSTSQDPPQGTPLGKSYVAVELGYRPHQVFAPGADTARAPLVMAKFLSTTEVTDSGTTANQDTMGGSATCTGKVLLSKTFTAVGPTATITATPPLTDRLADSQVTFTTDITPGDGNPSLAGYTYEWTFVNDDDTQTSAAAEPTMHFTKLGDVDVTLVLTDDLGSSTTIAAQAAVTVESVAPFAAFTVSPLAPTAGQEITFSDSSEDPDGDAIVAWNWDFNNDGVSDKDTSTATHAFNDPGTYKVRLTVTDETGKSSTRELRISVCTEANKANNACALPNSGPLADFSAEPLVIKQGESIQFTDKSSDSDGTVNAWSWNFGDGTASDEQNPLHVFDMLGTFHVKLTVTDDGGLQGSRAKAVRVLIKEPDEMGPQDFPEPPIAAFTFSPENPTVGKSISFSDATASESTLSQWTWFFGDGSPAQTGKTVRHTFEESGNFRVRMTVVDEFGATDSTEQLIQVSSGESDDNDAPGIPLVLLLGALALAGLAARRRN